MARNPYLSLSVNPSGQGSNPKAWKLTSRDAPFSFETRLELAKIAHRGVLDSLWLPDLPHHIAPPDSVPLHALDPQIMMAAISSVVPDVGFVPTVSSSYSHPFTVARNIATLNGISNGRAGVNIVASYNPRTGQNFGDNAVPAYDERYNRAEEYFDVITKLFESFRRNPDFGSDPAHAELLIDPALVHDVNFVGKHFNIRGPITMPETKGDRPLIANAGGSDQALELAAKYSDVIYVVANDLVGARKFAADMTARLARHGRTRESLRIVPGIVPIVGSTTEEAQRKADYFTELAGYPRDPVQRISEMLALDPATLHPDKPLTPEQMEKPSEAFDRPIGFFRSITDIARNGNLTVRELYRLFQLGIGHKLAVGTPEELADIFETWFREGAADGFVMHFQHVPNHVAEFVDNVIPILQKRGIRPHGYTNDTLRQRFGLVE
jgi:FMN-dependent oxidoreductase (nitrilotriacetate monooxygenase family)